MDISFVLCLPREEASVPVVRHICDDALQVLGVAQECIDAIALAVTEACTNVLDHASSHDQEYEVQVQISNEQCDIRVTDAGGGFDPAAATKKVSEPSDESGRGILLMSALVDELRFVSKPESGTIVHLEKRLHLNEDSVLNQLSPTSGS